MAKIYQPKESERAKGFQFSMCPSHHSTSQIVPFRLSLRKLQVPLRSSIKPNLTDSARAGRKKGEPRLPTVPASWPHRRRSSQPSLPHLHSLASFTSCQWSRSLFRQRRRQHPLIQSLSTYHPPPKQLYELTMTQQRSRHPSPAAAADSASPAPHYDRKRYSTPP